MKLKIQKTPLYQSESVKIYQDTTGTFLIKVFSNEDAFEKEKQILQTIRTVIPGEHHPHFCLDIPQSNARHTKRKRLIFPKYDMDLRMYLLNPPKLLDFEKLDRDISTALTLLHNNGFVHNDVKPENILVDVKNNRFLLADFGLTTLTNAITNGIVGTPSYMSPRMLKRTTIRPDNDWWSYACVLVNALTVYCLDTTHASVENYSVDFEPDEEQEMTCANRDYLQLFQGTNTINTLFTIPTIADDLCKALQLLAKQTPEMQQTFIQVITRHLFLNRTANAPTCKDFSTCIVKDLKPEWAKHSNKWVLPANRYEDPVVQKLLRKALTIFLWFAKDTQCRALFSIQ